MNLVLGIILICYSLVAIFVKDSEVLSLGIGLINVVSRTTASSQDLSTSEIRDGCRRLVEKLQLLQVTCYIIILF